MSEKHKIKKIKEFLVQSAPQFDIILRRESNKSVDFSLATSSVMGGDLKEKIHTETLFPPDNGLGIIQIVKRISDDQMFHQGDLVIIDCIGSCFILEFQEDLINCLVAGIFEQESSSVKKLIEINRFKMCEQDKEETEDGESTSGVGFYTKE